VFLADPADCADEYKMLLVLAPAKGKTYCNAQVLKKFI
jgi:hypothetical protein